MTRSIARSQERAFFERPMARRREAVAEGDR